MLAAPYLADWQAKRPWQVGPGGTVQQVAVPGLRDPGLSPLKCCMRRPWLLPRPAWVPLEPGAVAVWTHPASETWGIAHGDYATAWPLGEAVGLTHVRMRPARGGGSASLDWSGVGALLSSGPGEAGLDALVRALEARLGVRVSVVEDADC